jgi:acetyltransferase-like isoleucine patch superfamily enzyme
VIKTTAPSARIIIGNDVGISGCTISARVLISIGNRVMLGSGCLLTDNDAHPVHPEDRADFHKTAAKPIIIDEDVFIGARAIILKGVHLKKGCVVGAGSVVTINAPEYSILTGNPAKIIKNQMRQNNE